MPPLSPPSIFRAPSPPISPPLVPSHSSLLAQCRLLAHLHAHAAEDAEHGEHDGAEHDARDDEYDPQVRLDQGLRPPPLQPRPAACRVTGISIPGRSSPRVLPACAGIYPACLCWIYAIKPFAARSDPAGAAKCRGTRAQRPQVAAIMVPVMA